MAAPMAPKTLTSCGRLFLRFASSLTRNSCGNGKQFTLKIKPPQRCLSISATRQRQQIKATSSLSDKPYTEEFLQEMDKEYQLGKRHLANMMGEDPKTFTQEDVDRAISYLLPSGLHDKLARPMLKPPDQIFPKQKALQWGKDGRPFSFLFYTGKANYYGLMHEAAQILSQLNRHEDKMLIKGVLLPESEPWPEFNKSVWIDKISVEKMITEAMDDHQYRRFVELMEHIARHPYAKRSSQFILKFRKELVAVSMKQQVHPLMYDENGVAYMEAEGRRKSSRAKVTLRDRGTGEVTVNGLPLVRYFRNIQDREQIMLPLEFVDRLGQFDVEATVWWGGTSGQAGAIRLGISRALCSFLTEPEIENMRLAGLLTSDLRRKERKKPGQKKARKKFSWRKR